ncbi:MAG TPA: hypothetical protein VG963_31115 [Polyangiaceae bacterium]|nr:hypothetical protein [Polyangiaceae bacterium]
MKRCKGWWHAGWVRAWAGSLVLGVAGCSSTGVGNPGVPAAALSLAIVADQDDDSAKLANAGDAGPSAEADAGAPLASSDALPGSAITRAALVIGSLRWLPCDASIAPVVQNGPFIVDLVAGTTEPALPPVTKVAGGFCGFDAPLAPARVSAELAGRSLVFAGTRADGVGFLLFANVRAILRVRAERGEIWGLPSDTTPLLWALRPRRWAGQSELAAAAPDEDPGALPTIVIDVDRHPLLFALIRARLASESGVFLDTNDNGVLDPEERARGALGTATSDPEN